MSDMMQCSEPDVGISPYVENEGESHTVQCCKEESRTSTKRPGMLYIERCVPIICLCILPMRWINTLPVCVYCLVLWFGQ